MSGAFENLAALALRRIRLLTALLVMGAVWFIAADGASSSAFWIAAGAALGLAAILAAIRFGLRALRRPPEGNES